MAPERWCWCEASLDDFSEATGLPLVKLRRDAGCWSDCRLSERKFRRVFARAPLYRLDFRDSASVRSWSAHCRSRGSKKANFTMRSASGSSRSSRIGRSPISKKSRTETPKAVARSTSVSKLGANVPRSRRLTVSGAMPIFSARSVCVRPARSRWCLISAPTCSRIVAILPRPQALLEGSVGDGRKVTQNVEHQVRHQYDYHSHENCRIL